MRGECTCGQPPEFCECKWAGARFALAEAVDADLAQQLDKLKPYLDEATRLLIGPPRFGAAARAAEIRREAGLTIIDQFSRETA